MNRAFKIAAVAMAFWLAGTASAIAYPLPTSGSYNLITRTVVLGYGKAPYSAPVVTGFPNKGYADIWDGASYVRVTTPAAANALLMAPRTHNSRVRVVIPHKDIDVTGDVLVRHGLRLGRPYRTRGSYSVTGVVAPGSKHYVRLTLQRKYFGIWWTKQRQTVTSGRGGKFQAKFTAHIYTGIYRVKASVNSDAYNYSVSSVVVR